MAIKERISEFIKIKGISALSFEKQCGLSVGFVRKIVNTITVEKMMNILSAFPDLNANWLLTGRGNPIIQTDDVQAMMNEGEKFLRGEENSLSTYFAPIIYDNHREQVASGHASNFGDVTIENGCPEKLEHEIALLQKEIEMLNNKVESMQQTINAKDETIELLKNSLGDKDNLIKHLSVK